MNPLKELRSAMAWSQTTLASELGVSHGSVRAYEAGHRVPPYIIEKLKTIAAEHGFADIALRLSSDDWQVARVFQPGETIISQAKKNLARRKAEVEESVDYHALLDEVLAAGHADITRAVQSNLIVFASLARARRPKLPKAAPRKRA